MSAEQDPVLRLHTSFRRELGRTRAERVLYFYNPEFDPRRNRTKRTRADEEPTEDPTKRPKTGENEDNEESQETQESDESGRPQNRTTVGVEFEFLLAQEGHSSKDVNIDPHPEDNRFLATTLEIPQEAMGATYYMRKLAIRNEILHQIRQCNLAAANTVDDWGLAGVGFIATPEFGWGGRYNQPEVVTDVKLDIWHNRFFWDINVGPDVASTNRLNREAARAEMLNEFDQFHADNGLALHETTHQYIDAISDERLEFSYARGHKRPAQYRAARTEFRESAKREVSRAMLEYERELEASQRDPNFVEVPQAMAKYSAWTCHGDETQLLNPVHHPELHQYTIDSYRISQLDRINIPPSYLNPAKDGFVQDPREAYEWFEGELVSPIMDFNHHDTIPAIQRACAALRDNFRIHKPMSTIHSGLHIHFGMEQGWTLLHLKKFTTLWLILEENLEKLHRRDRSDGSNAYVSPHRTMSPIAQQLRGVASEYDYLTDIETTDPTAYAANMREMGQHIPSSTLYNDNVEESVRNAVTEVWKYETISKLASGITPGGAALDIANLHTSYMRYRMEGDTLSVPNNEVPSTIEIRMMQGTLDADHIAHWMRICERLVIFSRDSTAVEFFNGISDLAAGSRDLQDIIGIPAATMDWFRSRVPQGSDGQDGYFRYPDNDKIDWSDPFMVPGYGDTHGHA
ncbi:uncharacterized protein F4812DRAFT_456925 [Daldinia caldariorum]|uniref:uncharacterized protein n=1 Tax=Daldinia caldariorum TaxID=326644 RepID=UPI002007D218|nr:uncharacterized protein F4812DRAFT_456925 [Daldinia caldariorum]KAI1470915.1 hypothetical protein F4812DRAFT_456925 [Daldinia caldariorum]